MAYIRDANAGGRRRCGTKALETRGRELGPGGACTRRGDIPRLRKSMRWAAQLIMAVCAAGAASLATAAPPAHIRIDGQRIFPESLTSTSNGTVFIGSIGAHAIYRAGPGEDVAKPWIMPERDGLETVLGVVADERANTLWACSDHFIAAANPQGALATLYAFDLKSGAFKRTYPFPTPNGACDDIAIERDGTVLATDSNNMEVVRLAPHEDTLHVWVGNGAFGPKGAFLDGIAVVKGRVLVNTFVAGKLFSVEVRKDGAAGPVTAVSLDRAVDGPDGMRPFGRDGVLLAEGHGGRLSRITFHGNSGHVVTVADGFTGGPVAVTVVGRFAYVLEGQLDSMRAPPGTLLMPFRATAVALGGH
jgi:hypothetical protein